MAQALFEALTGGVSGIDQTSLAVQSLLDVQTIAPESLQDEDDVFQCGKCRKQFTSLQTFITHKQSHCMPGVHQTAALRTVNTPNDTEAANQNAAAAYGVQTIPVSQNRPIAPANSSQASLTSVSAISPLPSFTQNMVLSDDIITFNIDPGLQAPTLQMATSMQNNPFLSQVAHVTPFTAASNLATGNNQTDNNAQNGITIYSPVASTATHSSSNGTMTFSSVSSANQMQPLHLSSGVQQIALGPFPEKTLPQVLGTIQMIPPKSTPTKAGRKSAQTLNNYILLESNDEPLQEEVIQGGKKGRSRQGANYEFKRKLQCQYCSKVFAKNFDLQQHVRSHTGEKPFQCIVCGRAFAQKSNVKKHMSTHMVWPSGSKGTLPMTADILNLQDTDETQNPGAMSLSVHISQGQTVSMTPTSNEPSVEPLREDVNPKAVVDLVIDSSYLCQYCPEKFKSYFSLKTHMVKHKDVQVYRCVVKTCNATFKALDEFLTHTKTHDNEMTYKCHVCNHVFPTLYDLGVHQYQNAHPNSCTPKLGARQYQCSQCWSKYSTAEGYEHHMSSTSHHYPCSHCDKVFASEKYLRRHLQTHGQTNQYECSICHKMFKQEHYLKMHMLIHSGAKPFSCDQCSACFNRKDKLSRHKLGHLTIKKHKCPFRNLLGCKMAFHRPDKLKAHVITHSKIRPYTCSYCRRGFTRRAHLIDHERRHVNNYRYKCETCLHGFMRSKLLVNHKCHGAPKEGVDGTNTGTDAVAPFVPNIRQVNRSRSRRQVGRPKKRMISTTDETVKQQETDAARTSRRKRGRPRKFFLIEGIEPEALDLSTLNNDSNNPGKVINVRNSVDNNSDSNRVDGSSNSNRADDSDSNNIVPQIVINSHRGVSDIPSAVNVSEPFQTQTLHDMNPSHSSMTAANINCLSNVGSVELVSSSSQFVSSQHQQTLAVITENGEQVPVILPFTSAGLGQVINAEATTNDKGDHGAQIIHFQALSDAVRENVALLADLSQCQNTASDGQLDKDAMTTTAAQLSVPSMIYEDQLQTVAIDMATRNKQVISTDGLQHCIINIPNPDALAQGVHLSTENDNQSLAKGLDSSPVEQEDTAVIMSGTQYLPVPVPMSHIISALSNSSSADGATLIPSIRFLDGQTIQLTVMDPNNPDAIPSHVFMTADPAAGEGAEGSFITCTPAQLAEYMSSVTSAVPGTSSDVILQDTLYTN